MPATRMFAGMARSYNRTGTPHSYNDTEWPKCCSYKPASSSRV